MPALMCVYNKCRQSTHYGRVAHTKPVKPRVFGFSIGSLAMAMPNAVSNLNDKQECGKET